MTTIRILVLAAHTGVVEAQTLRQGDHGLLETERSLKILGKQLDDCKEYFDIAKSKEQKKDITVVLIPKSGNKKAFNVCIRDKSIQQPKFKVTEDALKHDDEEWITGCAWMSVSGGKSQAFCVKDDNLNNCQKDLRCAKTQQEGEESCRIKRGQCATPAAPDPTMDVREAFPDENDDAPDPTMDVREAFPDENDDASLPPNGEGDGSKICIGAGGSVACDRGTRCNIHGTVETRSGGSTKDDICIMSTYLLNDGQRGAPSKICIGSRKAVECEDQDRQCNHTPSELAYTCGRLGKLYAVGHMANTLRAVEYFQGHRYNALEMDVQYDETSGEPVTTYHESPCDCTCPWVGYDKKNVCTVYSCGTGEPFPPIIEYLATNWHDLPLLWLDAKPKGDDSVEKAGEAGEKMVRYIEKHLLAKGFRGIVLVDSVMKEYLRRASSAAAALPEKYRNQLYFSYYNAGYTLGQKLAFMRSLATPQNIIFHAGISACSPSSYSTEISLLRGMWERDQISNVFTWSVDTESNWQKYHALGASGIITNEPDLPLWAGKKGIEMAQVGDGSIRPCAAKATPGGNTCEDEDDSKVGTEACLERELPFSYGSGWLQQNCDYQAKHYCSKYRAAMTVCCPKSCGFCSE